MDRTSPLTIPAMRLLPTCAIFCLLILSVSARATAADPTTHPADGPAPSLHVGKLAVGKVLFLGNSITLHPPAPFWAGNWGMAASSADKDYVHLLLKHLTEAAGGEPKSMVKNIADFERQHSTYDIAAGLKPELEFTPDLVVLAIGENVPGLGTDDAKAAYSRAFSSLIAILQSHGHPAIFVRSCFWPDATKDNIMHEAAGKAGCVWIDISALSKDPGTAARSERKIDHPGVAGHPGDKGMRGISDAIWAAIQTASTDSKP